MGHLCPIPETDKVTASATDIRLGLPLTIGDNPIPGLSSTTMTKRDPGVSPSGTSTVLYLAPLLISTLILIIIATVCCAVRNLRRQSLKRDMELGTAPVTRIGASVPSLLSPQICRL